LLAKGLAINCHLEDPFWALFVAVILVIPLLVPSFIQYIAPSISKVAIPKFIEVSFARVESASFSLTSFFQGTKGFAGETIASEFAMSMTSLSMDILDVVGKVQVTGDEVFVVDLLEGKSWIPPNLYFLAFLLMYRTSVRQIVFVETRGAQESFIGMCSTEGLADALAKKFPVLSLRGPEMSGFGYLVFFSSGPFSEFGTVGLFPLSVLVPLSFAPQVSRTGRVGRGRRSVWQRGGDQEGSLHLLFRGTARSGGIQVKAGSGLSSS
jgi:hypothetical protein